WPVAMPGIIQNVLPLVGPGQDAAIAKIGGQTVIVASVTGGSLEELNASGQVVRTMQQTGPQAFGAAADATDRSVALNLFESASVGDLLGTGTPDIVKYELSLSQAANLLLVGQNFPYNHLIGAFDGRMADMTREGYLFQWRTRAPACQSEWPSFRHDQQDSGNYNHDGTPPGAPSNMTLSPLGAGLYRLSFTAPGSDGPCGTPASYVTELDG